MKSVVIFADEAWTDETDPHDRYYRFYGGCLVEERLLDQLNREFEELKIALGLQESEIKWSKVTSKNAERIAKIVDWFFEHVSVGNIKYRHLFCDKVFTLDHLTSDQRNNGFFILYYYFIKYAFGLPHCPLLDDKGLAVRVNLDRLPQAKAKREAFVEIIRRLPVEAGFVGKPFKVREIADVDSKKHPLLQCCDLVIGAFGFYLNRRHLNKPAGSYRRAETTIAKEKLYRHIYNSMRDIDAQQRGSKGFNAAETTGTDGDVSNRWHHQVRIWKFEPRGSTRDATWSKDNWLPRRRNFNKT